MAGNRANSPRIIRIVIGIMLAALAMTSLSGCLGFDVHISTPFDEIEQGIENFERGIEDGFAEYGDGDGHDDERDDDRYESHDGDWDDERD